MLKIEVVRCLVASPNPQTASLGGGPQQVRYIPKDIYRLWRFIMVNTKGFEITEELFSFWVDDEAYAKESREYGEHDTEKVVQVFFRYYKGIRGGRPVIRFFPQAQYNKIIQFFIRNFSSQFIKKDLEKTSGFFIEKR